MNDLKNDVKDVIFNFSREIFYDDYATKKMNALFKPLGIDYKICVDQHGGMDQGSDYYVVSKFSRGLETVYTKHYGFYASGIGAEYEDYEFVTPVEVKVIQWRFEK